ncbi:MAG: N-glycosylase/DNA lyase [Candidatus Micrarchaeota archaeon]
MKGETELIAAICAAKRKTHGEVRRRIAELKRNSDWFSELCFCLLTANWTAEGGMRIQKEGGDFASLPAKQIRALLKRCGHRFPNARAKYICEAKRHRDALRDLRRLPNDAERREWLVRNVRGLGYKEASHFLRNVGFLDAAIIDRHILNVLAEYGIIKKPKTLTRRRYLEIEGALRRIARRMRLSLGELDFYLWWMKTGKILK